MMDTQNDVLKQAAAELAKRRQIIDNLLDSYENLDHVRQLYHDKYHKQSSMFSGKGVVYSGIFGGYDYISEPQNLDGSIDYVLFTDTPKEDYAGNWEIRVIDNPDNLPPNIFTRLIKMHPWDFLEDYDWSIWVDGSIAIKKDLKSYVDTYAKESGMLCFPHHRYTTLQEEATAIVYHGKGAKEKLEKQLQDYLGAGFSGNGYHVEAGCIARSHHDEKLRIVMDDWWQEFCKYDHYRDQMSLDYVCWKNNYQYDICDLLIYSNPWFSTTSSHE